MPTVRMTADAARRMCLASAGFGGSRPEGRIDRRHFRSVMRAVDLVQLDSVNVSARTHYWVFESRLGPYDRRRLDAWLWRSGEHFEYWAHEASVLPQEIRPYLAYRMRSAEPRQSVARLMSEHPGYLESVLAEVAERGPIGVKDLTDPGSRSGAWWGWGKGKLALEWHFRTGAVTVADRPNFHRLYDLSERVIDPQHLRNDIDRDTALTQLIRRSALALGVATAADLADYYRIRVGDVRRLVPRLISDGTVREVAVDGWGEPGYRHAEASIPRSIDRTALISPFDPLIWFRARAERVFGMRYRIEIYVPEPERVHGYYVLPVLMDGGLVARVDLKTDRQARVLRVRAAHLEPGRTAVAVAGRLAAHLEETAEWLGCGSVAVEDRGDLAAPVRAALS